MKMSLRPAKNACFIAALSGLWYAAIRIQRSIASSRVESSSLACGLYSEGGGSPVDTSIVDAIEYTLITGAVFNRWQSEVQNVTKPSDSVVRVYGL